MTEYLARVWLERKNRDRGLFGGPVSELDSGH